MKSLEYSIGVAARKAGVTSLRGIEPFAQTEYEKEVQIKQAAFDDFVWSMRLRNIEVTPLIPAVKPRRYRTTSQRRSNDTVKTFALVHGDGSAFNLSSDLEPKNHLTIYSAVQEFMNLQHKSIRSVLNHVVIRGTYDENAVILNVAEMNADLVRSMRRLSASLQRKVPSVKHVWLFNDPRASKYFFDLERPAMGVGAKKIDGSAAWKQTVRDVDFQVGVFGFSRVNLAMLPTLVDAVEEGIMPQPDKIIQDLYCGYGLFGGCLVSKSAGVVAVDADEASVKNARFNISQAGGKAVAITSNLSASKYETFMNKLPLVVSSKPQLVVVDPPRTGTDDGLINAISKTRPERISHVFSGPDEIERSLKEWNSVGYRASKMIPIDMFPGTPSMEVVVHLAPR
jgi:tRNA/tmRNA/rRNA uracil-C5-methylase (TrmA/RlmC/RlmD family)